MSTLKIEAGKHYRTKGGYKARVYAEDGVMPYANHGAVWQDGWRFITWDNSGKAYPAPDDAADLIAEWREPQVDWSALPKWAQWVARDEDGEVYWYMQKAVVEDSQEDAAWFPVLDEYGEECPHWGIVPEEYVLHREGDWRESLEQRPEASK